MFDPGKPYNALPLLPNKPDCDTIELWKAVNKANIALAKLNIRAEKLPNSMLLISPLLVRESVASSGIENINTTVQEVFEAEILPEEQRTGPAKEVLHYRDAMIFGMERVKKRSQLTLKDFSDLQALVEPEKTGIRKEQVRIINHSTNEILYTPPAPNKLERLLENLEDFANTPSSDMDPLMKAAVFHYQFEAIHPFLDGNGRVGRILIVLYLVMMGRLSLPILFISGYIEKNRSSYYRILRDTTLSGDMHELVLFFVKGFEVQAMQTEQTIMDIEELMGSFKEVVNKKMKIYTADLLECLFTRAFLTIDYVQTYLKLSSRQTASKYLSTLVHHGLLKEKKIGKGKLFYSERFCKLLS
ncbi:MAG: Fic family protein [bacterium]|nr:Fic family protein [bacterium]